MNYSNIKYNDIANGEGVRTSLFVSGCRHHCKGCFNQVAWDFNNGKEFDENVQKEILESIKPYYISGLSLLGGEPFEPENQEGLIEFIRTYKKSFLNKPLWCWSGYLFEEIIDEKNKIHTKFTNELLGYIDVLVDGEFILDLKDISLKFRGSTNQRIIDVKESLKSKEIILYELRE